MKKKASTNAKAGDHHHGLSVPQSHPRSLKAPHQHQSKNKSQTITSIHTTIRSIHNNTHSSDNQSSDYKNNRSSDAAGLTARHHRKKIKKPLVTISIIKKKSRIAAYPFSVTSVGSYESPISQSSDNAWYNDDSKTNIQEKTQSNITRNHQIYTPTKCPGRKLCKVSNFNENDKSNYYGNNNKKSCSRSCKITSAIIGILLLIVTAIILAVLLTRSKTETMITTKTAVLRWNSTGLTVAGITGQFGNGSNQLNVPFGLAIDWSYTLYIADWSNHRVQKYLKNSSIGITVAGQASGSYNSTSNYLHYPGDVAVDWNGNVYVADTFNDRVQLWNSASTTGITVAGAGSTGNMSNQLNRPHGLAYDPNSGTLYISDSSNNRVMRYMSGASSGSVV